MLLPKPKQIFSVLKEGDTGFPFWNKKRKFLHVTGYVKEMLELRDSDIVSFHYFLKNYELENVCVCISRVASLSALGRALACIFPFWFGSAKP